MRSCSHIRTTQLKILENELSPFDVFARCRLFDSYRLRRRTAVPSGGLGSVILQWESHGVYFLVLLSIKGMPVNGERLILETEHCHEQFNRRKIAI